jgi:hypothetical protein
LEEIRAASQFVQGEPTDPIRRGEHIVQMVIAPVVREEFASAACLALTARGSGGFGSTGTFDFKLNDGFILIKSRHSA